MVARDLVDLNTLGPSPKDFTSIKLMVTLMLKGIPGAETSDLSHTFNSYTRDRGVSHRKAYQVYILSSSETTAKKKKKKQKKK